ncbi:MAG: hypothetical protein KDD46_07290 [Bdellovibrionales bacterium]|nr:hypothetical protein [Bdellovibrionales bacterium]
MFFILLFVPLVLFLSLVLFIKKYRKNQREIAFWDAQEKLSQPQYNPEKIAFEKRVALENHAQLSQSFWAKLLGLK